MPPKWRGVPHLLAALALGGLAAALGSSSCGTRPSQQTSQPTATQPLLPDSVAAPAGYLVPPDSLIPSGAHGASIRRGRAILIATRDSLPHYVGNRLACTNCHRNAGTRPESGPWVGSFASFPQYNARAGRVIRIEDRVNECLRRSLNGTPLPMDGRDMNDIVAYIAFLSRGVPHGPRAPWLGYRRLAPLPGHATAGNAIFAEQCARCHGPSGEGTLIAPPVWGPESYAIGAGMARINTAASYIRWNMPFDRPGSLTDQQAYDVAAFLLSHSRPDTPGKERDWPNGDPPPDAAYATLAARRPATPAR